MPNWSMNQIAIRGTKQEVINFLNEGLKRSHGRKKKYSPITENASTSEIEEKLRNFSLSLRSWLPMPRTFEKWDTTNQMRQFEWLLQENKKTKMEWKDIQEHIEELREQFGEEYQKYCDGYNAAKEHQQKKYGCVGWYNYNCTTLGTKWNSWFDDWNIIADSGNDFVIIGHCNTAWSMPTSWLATMQEKYTALHFYIYAWEESYAYIGYCDAKDLTDWVEFVDYDKVIGQLKAENPEVFADGEDEEKWEEQSSLIYSVIGDKIGETQDNFRWYICNK